MTLRARWIRGRTWAVMAIAGIAAVLVAPTGAVAAAASAPSGAVAGSTTAPTAAPTTAPEPLSPTQDPERDTVPADTVPADTLRAGQEGLYARPFIASLSGTSVGGYAEAHGGYFREDGLSDGFSMEFRRFNIFLFSAISPRVRLISELEFEHGTEEIALETALIDVQIAPYLVLRGGILLPPIGYFNLNHDSPRWNFVERPIVSTEIIPSTLSEVGFGVHGRLFTGAWGFSYDAYLTNGLQDGVLVNASGRTRLAGGKAEEQFAEDNNGSPAVSARVALLRPGRGELGLSLYHGAYNTFEIEGDAIDERRGLTLAALDLGIQVGPLALRGEAARVTLDVPPDLGELFADEQWGAHLDLSLPVWRPRLPGYASAALSLDLRVEYADFNVGTFTSTGAGIGDEVFALVPGLSFRPSADTVFRVNYRRHWTRDLLRNPTSHLGGVQVGFATYF